MAFIGSTGKPLCALCLYQQHHPAQSPSAPGLDHYQCGPGEPIALLLSKRPQYSSPLLEPVFVVVVVFERECHILLYTYHVLKLISIWTVERFPSFGKDPHTWHPWSKLISHQGQYMNSILACCWIFSTVFQIPYLQHNTTDKRTSKETFKCLPTSICWSSPWSLIMKFITYVSVSLDLISITLVIILNGFIINLLWRQRRKMQAAPCNTCLRQQTSCLCCFPFVLCPGSAMTLHGLLWFWDSLSIALRTHPRGSCIYYSSSSYVNVFGYWKQYLTESCWRLVRNPPLSREWNCELPNLFVCSPVLWTEKLGWTSSGTWDKPLVSFWKIFWVMLKIQQVPPHLLLTSRANCEPSPTRWAA